MLAHITMQYSALCQANAMSFCESLGEKCSVSLIKPTYDYMKIDYLICQVK